MNERPKGEADEYEEGAAPPPLSDRRTALGPGWQIFFGIGDLVAKLLIPLVIACVGWQIKESVARTQVGPAYVDLALDTIAQDPLTQPAEARVWAVDTLQENSPVRLEDAFARRLKAGWGFQTPTQEIGLFTIDTRESQPVRQVLDGHAFEVRADRVNLGDAITVAMSVSLVLPDTTRITKEAQDLSSTNILRLSYGPRDYLFRFERLAGPLAEFTVWKQSPGFREPSQPPGAPRTHEAPTD